jgi:hypothetical protein
MVMAYFEVLSWHFPGRTEKSHENPVRIAGLRVEVSTQDFLNMNVSHTSLTFIVYVVGLLILGICWGVGGGNYTHTHTHTRVS